MSAGFVSVQLGMPAPCGPGSGGHTRDPSAHGPCSPHTARSVLRNRRGSFPQRLGPNRGRHHTERSPRPFSSNEKNVRSGPPTRELFSPRNSRLGYFSNQPLARVGQHCRPPQGGELVPPLSAMRIPSLFAASRLRLAARSTYLCNSMLRPLFSVAPSYHIVRWKTYNTSVSGFFALVCCSFPACVINMWP